MRTAADALVLMHNCVNALVAAHRKDSNSGPYAPYEYEAWEAKCSDPKALN